MFHVCKLNKTLHSNIWWCEAEGTSQGVACYWWHLVGKCNNIFNGRRRFTRKQPAQQRHPALHMATICRSSEQGSSDLQVNSANRQTVKLIAVHVLFSFQPYFFYRPAVFFSHNKLTNNNFSFDFSDQENLTCEAKNISGCETSGYNSQLAASIVQLQCITFIQGGNRILKILPECLYHVYSSMLD